MPPIADVLTPDGLAAPVGLRTKDLLSIGDLSPEEIYLILDTAEAMKEVVSAVLASPQFLYLTEESEGPQAEPLSPHELAAKLSYFLWNTTPDDQLMSTAGKGQLKGSLSSEVNRLVADDRFSQFTGEFVSQWLSLDKFDVVNVSWERMKKETKRELRKEPIHFVTHLIRENLPLRNLLDSDFIVVNDVVAGYYGIGDRTEHGQI